MFKDYELMFITFELIFRVFEHKFGNYEHKYNKGLWTIVPIRNYFLNKLRRTNHP